MGLSTLSEVFAGKAKGIEGVEVPKEIEVKKPGFGLELNLDKKMDVLDMKSDMLDIGSLKTSALKNDLSSKIKMPKTSFDNLLGTKKKAFNVDNFFKLGMSQGKIAKNKLNKFNMLGMPKGKKVVNKFDMLGSGKLSARNPFTQMSKRMNQKVGMAFSGQGFKNSVAHLENKMFSRAIKHPDILGMTRLHQQKHISNFGDWDGDKVFNVLDCQPFNSRKQGILDTIKGWTGKRSSQGGVSESTQAGAISQVVQTTEEEEKKVPGVFLGHSSGIIMTPEDVATATPVTTYDVKQPKQFPMRGSGSFTLPETEEEKQLKEYKKLSEMDNDLDTLTKRITTLTPEVARMSKENIKLQKQNEALLSTKPPGLFGTLKQLVAAKTVAPVKEALMREQLKQASKTGAVEAALGGTQQPIKDKSGKIIGWRTVNPYIEAAQRGEALGAEALYRKEMEKQLFAIHPGAKKISEQFDIKKYGRYGAEYDPIARRLLGVDGLRERSGRVKGARGTVSEFFREQSGSLVGGGGVLGLPGGSPQKTQMLMGVGSGMGMQGAYEMVGGAGRAPFGSKVLDTVGGGQQSGITEMSSLQGEPQYSAPPPQQVSPPQPAYIPPQPAMAQQQYEQPQVSQGGGTVSPYSGRKVSYIRGPYRKRVQY